jgi:hypothetical protein
MMTDRELAASGYVHGRLLAGAGAWVAELLDTLDAVQATLHE